MDKAKHFDTGKPEIQWILGMRGLDAVARVGTYGAQKYGQNNWRAGAEWMRFLGSTSRHVIAVIRGEWLDKDTPNCDGCFQRDIGQATSCKDHSWLPHLAHAVFNCLILLEWHMTERGTDDRPK